MEISLKTWMKYKNRLSRIDDKAVTEMERYVNKIGGYADHTDEVIRYAYALTTRYGEAAAAAACEMYDAVASASGVNVPDAEPAPTPEYGEVAKAVNGTVKNSSERQIPRTVGRLVKRTGADTTLKNAQRDGAQFAWIPSGDTCAFCLTLASRGWQYMSDKALKNGHAEHIHPNCDCTYAVRFDDKSGVEGYNPDKYLEMYESASDGSSKEKINALRRQQYQENKDKINSQKREAYAKRKGDERKTDYFVGENGKALSEIYKDWIGDNQMQRYLDESESEEARKYIQSDFRKKSFIGDGSTAAMREFELSTGLNCGRKGGNHAQKVEDLIKQIRKSLLKDLPENDKLFLQKMLSRLERLT